MKATNKNRSKNIALCMSGINDEIQSKIIHHLSFVGGAAGYNVATFTSLGEYYRGTPHDKGEINIYNLINFENFDGFIIMPGTILHKPTYMTIINKAKELNKPVVCIDQAVEGCYNIHFPHEVCIKEIVKHFINHHKFKYINYINGTSEVSSGDSRLKAYRTALEENGIEFEESRVENGFFWSGPIPDIIDKFMAQNPRPQAIVCANDIMAITAIERLLELGYRVPEDVCVSGYDGLEMAINFEIPITTGSISIEKCIKTAVGILDKAINEGPSIDDQMDFIMDVDINYSKSCNCNDIKFTIPKVSKVVLYNEVCNANTFDMQMIRLNEILTGAISSNDFANRLVRTARHSHTERLWFMLSDDFLCEKNMSYKNFIENNPTKKHTSNKYNILLSMKDKARYFNDPESVSRDELLPDFHKTMNDYNSIIFVPMHFQDKNIGYIAFKYNYYYINYYFLYVWSMHISSNLENMRIQQEFSQLANHYQELYVKDSMTGLLNRRGFYESAMPMFKKAIENETNVSIISIDLDDLKPINDIYGHSNGDIALKTITKIIEKLSNPNFINSRFGGDEFVVFAYDFCDKESNKFMNNFKKELKHFNATSGKPYIVDASIGSYSCVPLKEDYVDDFIKKADERMYYQKSYKKRRDKFRNGRR